jgi:hypothetical protein
MSHALPVPKAVKDLFDDLLGRPVSVSPGDPLGADDLKRGVLVALYVDSTLTLRAVLGMDLPLATYAGAALGLLPAGGAQDYVADRELPPNLAENAIEICNVCNSLINREGAPHLKLYKTFLPGEAPPNDAGSFLLALGRRLDLTVDIGGYGGGRFALALAN